MAVAPGPVLTCLWWRKMSLGPCKDRKQGLVGLKHPPESEALGEPVPVPSAVAADPVTACCKVRKKHSI